MSEVGEKRALRDAAIRLLEGRGYAVTNLARGSGSPPFSRIEAVRGAERLVCAVKVVTREHGRIHFNREDGAWKVLREVDHVVHAWRDPADPAKVRVSLFEAATVTAAFDANHAALEEAGMAHIPSWLSPEREEGRRFTGSGFGDRALWSETAPLASAHSSPRAAAAPDVGAGSEAGIMDRIKRMLSEHMGVRPELIEVDVRVKI